MTAQIAPTPVFKAFDNNGNPLFGGQLFTYAAGTTTPQATYVDSTQTTQNTNPVILNSRGECNLWLDPTLSYKFVLQDSAGNQIWSVDNIQGQLGASASIIPTADNQFNIGSPSFRFANGYFGTQLYVGSSNTPILNGGVVGYWPQTAAELAASVTPVNYYYEPGDARRYGADPTGNTDSSGAFALWSAILGSYKGILIGTFKSSTSVTVPSGALVEWDASSVLKYTGSGAALTLSSIKDVTLIRPTIDISGAGTTAIAIQINGGWMVDIEHLKIQALTGTNTQVGVQINTSATAGANFGAYGIRITNPNICAINSGGNVKYGIQTLQTASDTVSITHLQILGGWINSGTAAGLQLNHCSSWRVEGTTLENVVDGLQYGSCDNGFISLGEVDATGYAVNPLAAASSFITLIAPSVAGSYTLGYLNTTNSTPNIIGYGGEIRMYPNGVSSSNYWISYKSQFSASNPFTETVAAGSAGVVLRSVDTTLSGNGIQKLQSIVGLSSTATPAKNFRGLATIAASATSVTVTFVNTEADTNFYPLVTPLADTGSGVRFWVGTLTTTGFTIYLSAAAPAGGVPFNWFMVR